MSRGRVNQVRIKDEQNDDIRSFANVKLQLFHERTGSVLVMTISPGEETELNLNDCTYIADSSIQGKITCIRNKKDKQLVTIMDRNQECVDLLNEVYKSLQGQGGSGEDRGRREEKQRKSPSHSPSPPPQRPPSPPRSVNNEKVNKLLKALNDGDANNAATFARDLARNYEPIRFALDMINESGNAAPRPPPEPVQEPIRLRLSIESFLAENNDQTYDVAILPGTTVKDLKDIIAHDANVAPDHQFWYIDRNHLPDKYQFGISRTPSANDGTKLILYITKPQNA